MEKIYNVKLDVSCQAYGKFAGTKAKPLVIVVHGLPCTINEGIYERACEHFQQAGYATYRFGLYDWHKDARQLIDCTLITHAKDLDTVVAHFRENGFKKIFVAGHSFGGPTILLSTKQDFDAAVLWDPSYDISVIKKKYGASGGKFIKALNGYFMRWGVSVIIGKKMAEQIDHLEWDGLPENFHVPLKIIAAQKGVLMAGCKKYIDHAHEPKALEVLIGATHYFDDTPTMQQRLFTATQKWFEKQK
ncbi:MAG: alpha/beta hydrolase [Patescibacteria group bacterium]